MARYEEHPSKVSAWKEGSFVVAAFAEDADCTVWMAFGEDDDGEPAWEGLLAKRLNESRARIAAVPFWVYDLNVADEVEIVPSAEGPLVATRLVLDAGNVTFRVVFQDDDQWERLMRDLEQHHCWFDVRSPRLVALSAPPTTATAVA